MISKDRASQYRGVYKCGKKWKSQIQIEGIQYYLGVFSTEQEAADRYNRVTSQIGRKIDPAEQPADTAESIRRCLSKMHKEGKTGGNGDQNSVEMSQSTSSGNDLSNPGSPNNSINEVPWSTNGNGEGGSPNHRMSSRSNNEVDMERTVKLLKLKISLGKVLRSLNDATIKYVDEMSRPNTSNTSDGDIKDRSDLFFSQQIKRLASHKDSLTTQILRH